MFELDLRDAKLLKKFLSVRYENYEVREIGDICTLTRMCICALFSWFWAGVGLTVITIIFGMLLSPLMLVTMYLPESLQIPYEIMEIGVTTFIFLCLFCVAGILTCTIMTLTGNMQFAPEYMKRPLRKLFKKKVSLQDDTPPKEKEPSQTWVAIKEMCKSIKDKTCIKVKM